jgi:hypothetical protein
MSAALYVILYTPSDHFLGAMVTKNVQGQCKSIIYISRIGDKFIYILLFNIQSRRNESIFCQLTNKLYIPLHSSLLSLSFLTSSSLAFLRELLKTSR